MRRFIALIAFLIAAATAPALAQTADTPPPQTLLVGARILNQAGDGWIENNAVLVIGARLAAIGPAEKIKPKTKTTVIDLAGLSLVPGLIDLHTHLLLHPYDEASWNDQVLSESLGLRTARAVAQAKATLDAGFTTIRDLGTEGAGYADVGLRDAIQRHIIPGPRMFVATRAIVASGAYGPAGFDPRWTMPKGAQIADGVAEIRKVVRQQIAAGADWVKVYADYRRRPGDPSTPTFSQAELNALVDEAHAAGRPTSAHATTDEAIRRAVAAGIDTIEHGTFATDQTLRLMKDRGVVLCPTLAASEAMATYSGWTPGAPEPARIVEARQLMKRALRSGVTIACGSDAGVFSHGDNAREIELMVDYGMSPQAALASATSIAANTIGRKKELGSIATGFIADLIAVEGDPLTDPGALRNVRMVLKAGVRVAP